MHRVRFLNAFGATLATAALVAASAASAEVDRSPVDLVFSGDERWLVTANQTSGTVSLVAVAERQVIDELPVGDRPTSIVLVPGQKQVAVTCGDSSELVIVDFSDGELSVSRRVDVGGAPYGVAVSSDGLTAYVSLELDDVVAVVDLANGRVRERIAVGRWPRTMLLSNDGGRLVVAQNGGQTLAVIDTATQAVVFNEPVEGINFGQFVASSDGQHVYFPWMIYRHNPINPKNIRAGWVLGSRIARIRFDEHARREAMTLDPQGEAIADPYGMALSSDEEWLVASGAGTHELLVYHLPDLVFQDFGGPGDHIDPALAFDRNKFYRVPLGGRPMAVRMARDDRHVFVANYLDNSVQVVDLLARRVAAEIDLGGADEPSLVRRGEAIFYDGARSLDQWYSCHTCHYEGGTNAVAMDTNNDHSARTFKTVLSLVNVDKTGPWTWHGWQTDLSDAMRTSMLETMQGREPSDDDVNALVAYLEELEPRPTTAAPSAEAVARGQTLFESERASCVNCHSGPHYTDGQLHDVGLATHRDLYQEFNTPSLVRVGSRARWLHDGRAKSLEAVLSLDHSPEKVSGQAALTSDELADLVAFLKSL